MVNVIYLSLFRWYLPMSHSLIVWGSVLHETGLINMKDRRQNIFDYILFYLRCYSIKMIFLFWSSPLTNSVVTIINKIQITPVKYLCNYVSHFGNSKIFQKTTHSLYVLLRIITKNMTNFYEQFVDFICIICESCIWEKHQLDVLLPTLLNSLA